MNISTNIIDKAIVGLIAIVVLFQLIAVLVPEAQTAGDTINDQAGLPLRNLFASDGVVFIIIMAAFVLVVVKGLMGKGK